MNKIIVTGATSMIGVALVEKAIANDITVIAIVRKHSSRRIRLPNSPLIQVFEANLNEYEMLDLNIKDCDTLYHIAWDGTTREARNSPAIQACNIKYTLDAVSLAHKCGCKKFIGIGSQAEYGRVNSFIDDSTPFNPSTPYGVSKYAAGLLSKQFCNDQNMIHIWGRVFSIYGHYDNDGTMINYALHRFANGQKAYFSSGRQIWNYLNESDAGEILLRIGQTVNHTDAFRIANTKSYPLREYIIQIASIMKAESLCEFDSTTKETPLGIQTCDSRLFDIISFRPQVNFSDGIKSIIQYRNIII